MVVERSTAVAKLFGLGPEAPHLGPLALHWYEWQCGLAGLCTNMSDPDRFQFDTQYPDYSPPRRGAKTSSPSERGGDSPGSVNKICEGSQLGP